MIEYTIEEQAALLLLNRAGSGRRQIRELLDEKISPSEIVLRIQEEDFLNKREDLRELQKKFDSFREMEQCNNRDIRIIPFGHSDYPESLRGTYDPPLLLYMKGGLEASDQAAVAIVGTRHPNWYGRDQTIRFAHELTQAGLTIVSGFAKGVDQIAHQTCLTIPHGRTLAVMGCGLDVSYPKGSEKLYEEITERGAILSEYALGTPPYAENFPKRNRIIAGLALGVLVIQANAKSGSLITAHEAVEEGRDVFAVPGPADKIASQGTHGLIKEGAYLADSSQDILQRLSSVLGPANHQTEAALCVQNLNPEESEMTQLLAAKAMVFDEIQSVLQCPAQELSRKLLQMELKGIIRKRLDQHFEARSQAAKET